MHSPASGYFYVSFPFTIDFELPAAAQPGTVELTISPYFGDGNGDRVLVLGTAAEASGRHSHQIGQMSNPGADVVSATPNTDIAHQAQAILYLAYTAVGSTTEYSGMLNFVLDFDTQTDAPTFSVVNTAGSFPTNFEFSFTTLENAASGSVKLIIDPAAGGTATDSHGTRTIVLDSAYEVPQSATITMAKLSTAAAALSSIASVSPAQDLVDGARYDMKFQYADTAGNAPADSSTVAGLELDLSTDAPTLINPSISGIASVPTNFNLTFFLPEAASPGTLKLTITPTTFGASLADSCSTQGNAPTTRQFVLHSSLETAGNHFALFSALSGVAAMVGEVDSYSPNPMCDLTDEAVYNFRIEYRDAALNGVASDEQIVVFDSFAENVTLSAPAQGPVIIPPFFDVTFTLPEEANPGSVRIVLTPTAGGPANDAGSPRVITLVSTVVDPQAYTVGVVRLINITNQVADVASVSPVVDLVHDAEYSVQILYQDRAGNDGASNTVTRIRIDSATEAPTLTRPAANDFVPTNIPVRFTIPETAKADSVFLRFDVVSSTLDLGDGLDYFDYHMLRLDEDALSLPVTDFDVTIPRLSDAVSTLAVVDQITLSPFEGDETASDFDLCHGTTYDVVLLYEDANGNPQASDTARVEFSGSTTIAPTLSAPVAGAALTKGFDINFTLPEPALAGTDGGAMRLDVVTLGSDLDAVALRRIAFDETANGGAVLARGDVSIVVNSGAGGGLENVDAHALVASISDATPLVDGCEYNFTLSYQDRAANPVAEATNTLSYHADDTQAPTVHAPTAGICLTETFNLTFTLPERALSGSLKVTATNNGASLVSDGASARVIAFADSVLARGTQSIAGGQMMALSSLSGLSQVASVTPATDLVDGAIYDFALKYQDAAGNPETVVAFPGTGGTFYYGGSTTQQHGMTLAGGTYAAASSGSIALGSNWEVGVYLPEQALPGSVQLTIARSDGVEDVNSPHVITFGTDIEAQSTLAVGSAGLNDPAAHVKVPMISLSSLVGSVTTAKVVSKTPVGYDMVDGALYRFTLSYRDCAGNVPVTVVRNLVAFSGSSTIAPDLAMSQLIASPFAVSFQTNERALTGTLQLIIAYAGGFTDAVSTRSIVFTSALSEPAVYSLSLGALSTLASDQSSVVASVTPPVDLVDGAEYSFTLSMEDAAANDAAIDTVSDVYFGGSSTRAPVLRVPATGSTVVEVFTVTVFIAERAAPGSVQLVFTRTGGSVDSNGPRTVTLTSAFEAYGNHTFSLGKLSTAAASQSEVALVSPAVDLVHMSVYTIVLSYQDQLSNPAAEHNVTDVTYDILTESMDLIQPTAGTAITTSFALNYNLGEAALQGSLKLTALFVSGVSDTNGDRVVVLNTSLVGAAGAQTLALAPYSTAAATLASVTSVSPATDLVDGATYNFKLEYQDLFSNTKVERSQNGVIYAADDTLPAIMSLPLANVKVPQDFQVRFQILEVPLGDTLTLTIRPNGQGTSDPNAERVITFVTSLQAVGTHLVTLNALSKLLLKVPETTSVSPAQDLINGAHYDVIITYRDSANNAAAAATVSNVEFDIVTDLPFIDAPASGNIKVEYDMTIRLTENAMPGTLRAEFNPIAGDNTGAGIRQVFFSTALDVAGSHDLAMTNLTTLVAQNANVSSVSPSVDLVHMAQYIVTIVYRDAIENAEATSGSVLMVHDTFTETPTLALPASSARFKEEFLIDFTLPEAALPSTVTMTFTRVGGTADPAAPRVIVFATAYEAAGQHNSDVAMEHFSSAVGQKLYLHSITPDTDLVHMAIYDVEISYQDVANNVLASAQNTGATFDILTETPTFTTPAHQSYPVETFLIQFTLPEDAMPGSMRLDIVPIAGGQVSDNLGARAVVFNTSVETAGTHSFNMASLATIVNDVEQVSQPPGSRLSTSLSNTPHH